MIIKKYGIELHRLTEADLEFVRNHRNSDFIRSKMFYQKIITKEEQKVWFEKINNDLNYYFLIIYNGVKIGMVHGVIESFDKKIATGGLFIWDTNSLSSHLPVIASVCTTDLTFIIMDMEKTTAIVRIDNEIAINYNISLGYTITNRDEKNGKIFMKLERDVYFREANLIRKAVMKISKEKSHLTWDDIHFPKLKPDNLYNELPNTLLRKVLDKTNW